MLLFRLKNVHGKILMIGNLQESKAKKFYGEIKSLFNELHLNSSDQT